MAVTAAAAAAAIVVVAFHVVSTEQVPLYEVSPLTKGTKALRAGRRGR